ncbi:spore germination protein [Candidatus Arthromitus sp. SFB-turkey]|uniref:spore germination protein n=1 Tax=Candidatus Arthromitus sp. SFB-turkey TaxID=1840217 RepID=UPI0007F4A108|nr:spore germination protein [Candidatus Arthromitus sp. SFB-turkey]OAT89609.1 spore gernimation protein [Candidatus Arthromitus sp. SFB-turkey]HJD00507.1 spore germination protein [Candidatus Dwaynia gallinarum]
MKESIEDKIFHNLDESISYLKNLFKDNTDIIFREFEVKNRKCLILYIDGMADRNIINNFVMETLLDSNRDFWDLNENLEKMLTVSDMKKSLSLKNVVVSVLSGETAIFIDGKTEAYIIATRSWPNRGVSEPSGESVIRGARDGFTETIRFNTALIRRRIRDTRLKVESTTVGVRSKTDVAIVYIDDIVNNDILNDVKKKLENIDIDAILDSGYIEQLIEGDRWNIFPQVQATERPEVVSSAIYEGKVCIVVDNSPFVLITPTTFSNLFQTPDDYNLRWIYSSFSRIIRFVALIISLVLPSLYVAVTSFHTSIIPTKLAYSIASSRQGIAFPPIFEAIIMEVFLAFLLEAVVRLPKAIGSTIGIVGGLIIGQAAVSAGLVSPVMIVVVALTIISGFMSPNYEITLSIRIFRILYIIMSGIIGFYGIILGTFIFLTYLLRMDSFGVPYLSPIVNMRKKDFKDIFVKYPLYMFKDRPKYMDTQDKKRQK